MPGSVRRTRRSGPTPGPPPLALPARRSRPWAFLPHAVARNTAAQCILNKFCEGTPDWVREFLLLDRPRLTAGLNFGKDLPSRRLFTVTLLSCAPLWRNTTSGVAGWRAAGYTLLLVTVQHALNTTMLKLNFDFVRDIRPVASIAGAPYVMVVHPSVPAKTVAEFIRRMGLLRVRSVPVSAMA